MRDDSVEAYLHRLESDLVDFKKAQLTGSDSVRTYNGQTSNNIWDFQWTSEIIGAFPSTGITVTFTANTQEAPFANLRAVVLFNGEAYDPRTIQGIGKNSIIIEQAFAGNTIEELKTTDIYKWIVSINTAVVGTLVQIKFYVDSTDRGVLSFKGLVGI